MENTTTATPIVRVKSDANVKDVAGTISKYFETEGVTNVTLNCIGASSTNQGIKSVAVARSFVASRGRDLICRPGFGKTTIDGNEKTVVLLVLTLV